MFIYIWVFALQVNICLFITLNLIPIRNTFKEQLFFCLILDT